MSEDKNTLESRNLSHEDVRTQLPLPEGIFQVALLKKTNTHFGGQNLTAPCCLT